MKNILSEAAHFLFGAKPGHRKELGIALLFIGLIIIPSGLLGYFSWLALENEKLLGSEKLRKSYVQFARLAAREFGDELEKSEKSWVRSIKQILTMAPSDSLLRQSLAGIANSDKLIARWFLFEGPGKIVYPESLKIDGEEEFNLPQTGLLQKEYRLFRREVERGEEYEYNHFSLDDALKIYTNLYNNLNQIQFKGIIKSYISRILIKKGDYKSALENLEEIVRLYPDMRDLKGMYLGFWAKFQIVVCLENLKQDKMAVEKLLQLYQDMFARSDEINAIQYADFLEHFNGLSFRLLSSTEIQGREKYQQEFSRLAEMSKKRISEKYFIALLDRKLRESILKDRKASLRFHYFDGESGKEPFVLAAVYLPTKDSRRISSMLALQLDIQELQQRLFSGVLNKLNFSREIPILLIDAFDNIVLGERFLKSGQPVAVENLDPPFDFWKVALFKNESEQAGSQASFVITFGIWMISLLLISIIAGAFIFIKRAQRAAHLSELKSTLVSNLSHELRTPLASIKMLAELLDMQFSRQDSDLEKTAFKERSQKYLRVIYRESNRLSRLIDNLLDFSRIERKGKNYTFGYEDPAIIIQHAVDAFRPQLDAEGFELEVVLNEDMPEIKADADAISQVISNLLSNAVKYSSENKKVIVMLSSDGDDVIIAVEDRGNGIPRKELGNIFNEFYRVDEKLNTHGQGGVGIGLFLAKQIINDHGGSIEVRSEPGKGSTFSCRLPAHYAELSEKHVAPDN